MENSEHSIRVLFIDDSEDIPYLSCKILKDYNYSIMTDASGGEGLEKVQDFKPQVIFLDMELPDMDGLVVANKIRTLCNQSLEKPIIYAFTNHNPEYFGNKLQLAGISRCIQKAMGIKQLKMDLVEAIEGSVSVI